ncbi:ketosteroid isomerase family protein [Alteromonas ponticola]|uniref:Ketosteroid isomerase family protein n=1 Tax=Alteromonas aquimaris TaxID=2998417 RepID=A0ABT3P9A3_9ALTE|nr:ketosteroid isomerase family protein [Alteromonas aquimaris]MCW8109110.1 ketosteroid isomerase family protein [Alteromonas aquimaris]
MEEFFRKYTTAFDVFDAEKIASFYRLPCAISDADGVQTFIDRAALLEKFSSNCEAMRSFGYLQAEFNILDEQQLGLGKVAITIGWRIKTVNSNIDFRTLYICHQIEHTWYIFSANVYEGSFSSTQADK